MESNYLTDKAGRDTDIERLESLLSQYRYVETEPPALPATNIIEFAKAPRRRRFALIFAASAGLSFVLLAGVWLRSGETRVTREVASNIELKTEEIISATALPKVEPVASAQPAASIETKPTAPKRYGPKQIARPSYAVYRSARKPVGTIVLTAEEKYAFDQLMLALAITSSKLKMVREKLDGTEVTQSGVVDK